MIKIINWIDNKYYHKYFINHNIYTLFYTKILNLKKKIKCKKEYQK